ncbi:MFS transporter [Actinoplanes sp. N902-109]|uniref:MFS transporter n=1 Tax=Actinoplanes sp. (strain N902-109) TaxID=649831 RepID=UPI0003293A09|nr:MFS transporter [Actinoplanes sp. N902-109]AGL20667.1 hypothetical protein L083_7157 [Actinoplanes sp. N902-109]
MTAPTRTLTTGRHWLVFGLCAAGFFFDSMDLQLMSLVAPVLLRQWELTPAGLGRVVAAAVLGMFAGACLFGALADRIGRRPGYQITIAVFAGFSALCALAQNPAQLMVFRFGAGLGIGGFIPIATTLLSEFAPPRMRGRLLALWGIAFPAGGLCATGVVSVLLPATGWRGVFLAGAAPALLLLAVRRIVPEAPDFRPAEGSAMTAVTGLLDRAHRRTTTAVWGIWFCWSFAYYGLILWLPSLLALMRVPLGTVLGYTIGFQLAAIAGRVATLLVVDRLGQRPLIVLCALAAAAAVLLLGTQHTLAGLIVAGYAVSFVQDGGFSGIVPFTPALYPPALRATGVGWANGLGRVASMVAPVLVGVIVTAGGTAPVFAMFAAAYGAAAGTAALAPGPTE